MTDNPYKQLALRLDALPNGFPPTEDGAELRLLEYLFRPEEAALAAGLRLAFETPAEIAERLGGEPRELRKQLKVMARRGLIRAGRADTGRGLGYGLLPFAVGIYEFQFKNIDAEMARLFEDYFQRAFDQVLRVGPQIHRVIPVNETVKNDMEVRPYESAAEIVRSAKSWGVVDCLCRQQQALIGNPCEHPIDVCMVLSPYEGVFEGSEDVTALTQEGALATLRRAAEAGLVHSVSNHRQELSYLWYICNCCTCSCGILRGMSELGVANVVARSAFVNTVDEELCVACALCMDACQFGALEVDEVAQVDRMRCVGCGVCVLACPEKALIMVRRPDDEIPVLLEDEDEWMEQRAAARGIDMDAVR